VPSLTRPANSLDLTFDSLSDLLMAATAPSPCPQDARSSHNHDQEQSWDLGVGFAGAARLAESGWPEGAQKAREYSDALFAKVSAKMTKNVFLFADEGMTWDLSRVVANEAECWVARHEVEGEAEGPRYIRLVVNVAASSGIDAAVLLARGAVTAALVELLEYAGHRCEIVVAHAINSKRRFTTQTTVKRFSEPLDMASVAYAVAHPSLFRRLIFSIYESLPTEQERREVGVHGGSYGFPVDMADDERGDIYLPCSFLDGSVPWQHAPSAVAWITYQLKRQGVTLNLSADDC
jgi:hypothetical protein